MVHGGAVKIAVVGANGFVGRELSVALVAARYDVIALSRHAPEIAGAEARSVDVADEVALRTALAGCEVAFYLVHRSAAKTFAPAISSWRCASGELLQPWASDASFTSVGLAMTRSRSIS